MSIKIRKNSKGKGNDEAGKKSINILFMENDAKVIGNVGWGGEEFESNTLK